MLNASCQEKGSSWFKKWPPLWNQSFNPGLKSPVADKTIPKKLWFSSDFLKPWKKKGWGRGFHLISKFIIAFRENIIMTYDHNRPFFFLFSFKKEWKMLACHSFRSFTLFTFPEQSSINYLPGATAMTTSKSLMVIWFPMKTQAACYVS